ncbi:hypothetical protein, partial [Microtetraspora sp. AC03309]|uniref:hypothetical protein n=1 Tax=Microtetraspora sp. AC03309 TaxID=2779376 RepID=UPI001E2A5603
MLDEKRGELSGAGSDFKTASAHGYVASPESVVYGVEAIRAVFGVPGCCHTVERVGGSSGDVSCPDTVDGNCPSKGLQLYKMVQDGFPGRRGEID